jgi:hypothetical protein
VNEMQSASSDWLFDHITEKKYKCYKNYEK